MCPAAKLVSFTQLSLESSNMAEVHNPQRRFSDQWDWPLEKRDGVVSVENNREKFEVHLENPYFNAKDIEVKILGNDLVIHCYHDASAESMSRELNRTYQLPDDIDAKTLKWELRTDPQNILAISARKLRK